ncbi:hypothetical protein OUZ56_014370 [Daphnia magna]|uniref:Uncharacterized protein n=1 Tax=Daphnia magna TaxID=35525 RepID=A0ABR0AJL8_9CRUS|nr:hypothetical protein OUZ56_014370 [Daphnia magna]
MELPLPLELTTEISGDGQTCDKKNQFGICAKLSCPPDRNGAICEKRRCVNNDERAAPNVAVISSSVAGVFVLLVILLVGAGFWIRSRRQSRGVPDHKVSVPPLANSYLFRAPSTMTRLANVAYNPRPPLLPFNVEDENPYEYETVDFPEPNPQPRLTNTTEQAESGYMIPNPLSKPKLPPPQVLDTY